MGAVVATRTKAGTQAGQQQGRAGAVVRPLPAPPSLGARRPGPGRARGLWGARAAPRGTHLIRRSWARSGLACASAPGPGVVLGCPNSRRAASARARLGVPGRGVPPALGPAGRRALLRGGGQRAAGRGARKRVGAGQRAARSPLGPARGCLCTEGPAPDTAAGRPGARVRDCRCACVSGGGEAQGVFVSFSLRQKKA